MRKLNKLTITFTAMIGLALIALYLAHARKHKNQSSEIRSASNETWTKPTAGAVEGEKAERNIDCTVPEMIFVRGAKYTTFPDPTKKIASVQVEVADFYLSKNEITFGQYDQFCRDNTYYQTRYPGTKRPYEYAEWTPMLQELQGKGLQKFNGERTRRPPEFANRPVIDVCWLDAAAYCLWLSEKTGRSFRLPTQLEWEFAARAGGDDPQPADLRASAWFEANDELKKRGYSKVRPAGRKTANPLGFHDMLGNAWEWCLDGDVASGETLCRQWKESRATVTDLLKGSPHLKQFGSGLFTGKKCLRGGGFASPQERVSYNWRMEYPVNFKSVATGFRIACSSSDYQETKVVDLPATQYVQPQEENKGLQLRTTAAPQAAEADVAELKRLMGEYRKLVGVEKLKTEPVLLWRDELMQLETEYEERLKYRQETNSSRSELPKSVQNDYFELKKLYAALSMKRYKGDEKEYVATFSKQIQKQGRDGFRETMQKRLLGVAQKLDALLKTTKLPKRQRDRAEYDGRLEMRKNILEAALKTMEPVQAERIGYRIQVLRAATGQNSLLHHKNEGYRK